MTLRKIVFVLGMMLLAGSLTGRAQNILGNYHGTVFVGDPELIPIEFIQSLDIAFSIGLTDDGQLTGSVGFRRPFRGADGRFADAQGPLQSFVINDDGSFEAISAPIRFTSCGRFEQGRCVDSHAVERTVDIQGVFVVGDDQCIPRIEAFYVETLRGLVFRPLTLAGPLSMTRSQANEGDQTCLATMDVSK